MNNLDTDIISKLNIEISLLNQVIQVKDQEIKSLKERLGKYENENERTTLDKYPSGIDQIVSLPMHQAMTNPLIIANILKYSKSSKSARLVCKSWNEILLSKQNPTLLINFNKFHDWFAYKNVDTSNALMANRKLDGHFISFCAEFSQDIQIMKISYDESLGNNLDLILTDYCPNLKELDLSLTCNWRSETKLSYGRNCFPTKRKLKKIKIQNDEENRGQHIMEFVRKLLNASPNVEMLSISGVGIPDLVNNTKVSSFEFTLLEIEEDECRNIVQIHQEIMIQMSRLLTQIKNSIKVLLFKRPSREWQIEPDQDDEPLVDLVIPVLPQLHTLQNSNLPYIPLGKKLEMLNDTQLPSLRNLTLSFSGDFNSTSSEIFKRITSGSEINCVNPGIKTLCIESNGSTPYFRHYGKLKVPFPSLEDLTFDCYEQAVSPQPLQLQGCEDLGLKSFNLNIQFESWYCRNIDFRRFLGLKKLSVTERITTSVFRDDLSNLEDTVSRLGHLDNAVLPSHIKEGRDDILSYISEKKLPVSFC